VTLFLQQTAGYSPLEAGLATTPVSLLLFVLSPRFGKISMATGPRLPMAIGPIVAGCGLLLLLGVGAEADYATEILPGIVVFGLGLAATVAPLTATALNSVEGRHAGVASGINNGVSRVAGLLAIAILGALISGQFGSTIDRELAGTQLSQQGREVVDDAKADPLPAPDTDELSPEEAEEIEAAATAGAEDGFHLGLLVGGALMILGGVIAGFGIQNPSRPGSERQVPGAVAAGECARCPDEGRTESAAAPT
jgi:hypothetical protein